MSFLERAKSMHERGETVRAAVLLAEGLKREPEQIEALEWLLHLYVEEIRNPGLEREILRILELQENGHELLALVEAELVTLDGTEKLEALSRVRERDGLMPPPGSDGASGRGDTEGGAGVDEAGGSPGEAPGSVEPEQAGEPEGSSSATADEWASFSNPIAGSGGAASHDRAGAGDGGGASLPGTVGDVARADESTGRPEAESGAPGEPAFTFDDEPPAALKRVEQRRDERLKWLVVAGTAGFVFLAGVLVLGSGQEEPEVARFVPSEMEPAGDGEDRLRADSPVPTQVETDDEESEPEQER